MYSRAEYLPAKEDHGSLGRRPDRSGPGTAHVGDPVPEAAAHGLPEEVFRLGRDGSPEQHGERAAPQQVDAVALEAVGRHAAVADRLLLVEDEGGRRGDTRGDRAEREERSSRSHVDFVFDCAAGRIAITLLASAGGASSDLRFSSLRTMTRCSVSEQSFKFGCK